MNKNVVINKFVICYFIVFSKFAAGKINIPVPVFNLYRYDDPGVFPSQNQKVIKIIGRTK
jgi:hypothetical protein